MVAVRKFVRSRPSLVAIIALTVGLGCIWGIPTGGSVSGMMFVRLGLSIAAFAVITIAAGRRVITPTAKSIGFAFEKSIYLLAIALTTGAFAIGMALYQNKELLPDWPFQLALVVLLCLVVGAFEEGLFRGIVLSPLLARLGNTHRGLVGAVVASSLIFGVVHVAASLLSGQVTDGLGAAQAILKTVQPGILGAFLAAIFLVTRNLWGVVRVHCVNDLFAMLSEALCAGSVSHQYVSTDPMMATGAVIAYVIFTVLYVPILVSTVRMIKRVEVPCRGPFSDSWS
ncbi:CPBP family intramembrane metalloprotease [Paraeggerthella hongkongensis]|uniref:CPBP family intramembrane glutamic endopeptidase n=1 Tax=Paraeggerthella sp. TaxID=2897350 RepID=UPI000DF864BE|nr:CPBP family intramembrane metalloprotease [Paraeggerthella hongkongensis]